MKLTIPKLTIKNSNKEKFCENIIMNCNVNFANIGENSSYEFYGELQEIKKVINLIDKYNS